MNYKFENEIQFAIENQKSIIVNYENSLSRTIDPYIVYVSSTGKTLFDGYQTEGYSQTGSIPAWRRFNVSEITCIEVTNNTFDIRLDYNPNNSDRYSSIISKI